MITLRNAIDEITNTISKSSKDNLGGPFGAFVYKTIEKNDSDEIIEIIATGVNSVTINNDPTAHAEIVAIRNACKELNTYDLSEYSIYSSGFPCPMCLGAIIWSGIKEIAYSQTLEDAQELGFKDKEMYEKIFSCLQDGDNRVSIRRIPNDKLNEIYNSYKKDGVIY